MAWILFIWYITIWNLDVLLFSFSWFILAHPFIFNLSESLYFSCISWIQHTVESCVVSITETFCSYNRWIKPMHIYWYDICIWSFSNYFINTMCPVLYFFVAYSLQDVFFFLKNCFSYLGRFYFFQYLHFLLFLVIIFVLLWGRVSFLGPFKNVSSPCFLVWSLLSGLWVFNSIPWHPPIAHSWISELTLLSSLPLSCLLMF